LLFQAVGGSTKTSYSLLLNYPHITPSLKTNQRQEQNLASSDRLQVKP